MTEKQATLYRMITDKHVCPFGIKSKYLLEYKGYNVDDHHLSSRDETDAFKKEYGVETTPQTFVNGKKIGGYDDLRAYFGKRKQQDQSRTTYQPIIAVFAVTFLMAISASFFRYGGVTIIPVIELFVAFSMCVLAILKLRDLFSFSNQFITYDLLGRRYVPYAYIYPFIEAFAGISMISGMLMFIAAPAAFFIGIIGAISVTKAVYIEKRDIKCACVGGNSNVPLGAISLTENIMMIGMAIWMISK